MDKQIKFSIAIDTQYGVINKVGETLIADIDNADLLEIYMDRIYKASKQVILQDFIRLKEANTIKV